MTTSRRHFLTTAAGASTAALAGTLVRPDSVHARQVQAEGNFTPIRRNVGFFTMRGGTIGWLVNDDAVVVVDSQFPPEAEVCLAGLNARSGNRPVDALINSHHHGDHTGGNAAFRGAAQMVVAHRMAVEHMRNPPGGQPTPGGRASADGSIPDTTFDTDWNLQVGDEQVTAHHFGRAHTSGDAVITFHEANVVHMGDLMFHRRHPVVDRAAGATLRGWMSVLDRTLTQHTRETIYIFGHAGSGLPVTGTFTDVARFRDYLGEALAFVGAQIREGRSREEVLALSGPLPGFEDFGPFGNPGPREIRTCAWEELST